MKILRILLTATVMLSLTALAQQPSTDAPASREQVLKLFEVMHIRQQMRLMMTGMVKQQSSLVRDSLKNRYPQISEEDVAQVNQFMADTMRDFPLDGILDDMIPVYQKHLTQPDVEAMIVFYSSATGQKLMQEMPAMTSEGMQAAYPRMQKQMEKVMERAEERIKQKAKPNKETTPKSSTTTKHSTS